MARCTAPVKGHRTASAADNCPACRGRSGRFGGYTDYYYNRTSYPSYSPARSENRPSTRQSNVIGSGQRVRPRWSRVGSSVAYTPAEVQTLTPYRETVETRPPVPDNRDLFLCHAWNDRQAAAKDLYDLLVARKVSVWFSEVDLRLGTLMLREIDKGLANSRMGIVLVTPAFLERVQKEGSVSDKELSTLLRRNQLIPILHNTTYEALENVSPMLASRAGLTTGEDQTMAEVADKIAELIAL